MELVLATHNLHKIREFREMFKKIKTLDILSLVDFPDYQLPEETGKTFLENAKLKAEHASKVLNKFVLADDSGLVVPSLNGEPGVFSKRYAGENATCADNRKKLLQKMNHLNGVQRAAYFECCLALKGPSKEIKTVTGIVEGTISETEKGRHGFGYDSLFVKNDYEKTFAELDESVKNKISHRWKAFEKMKIYLESII